MTRTPEAIISAILDGVCDGFESSITDALRERRKLNDSRKALSIVKDTRVRFNDQASPKYLRGATATVTGRAQKNLLIKLDEDCGRFRAGVEVRCPVSIIDVTEVPA